MSKIVIAFVVGIGIGTAVASGPASVSPSSARPQPAASVTQLRLFTIDKGRLDEFAMAWQSQVYPLRTQMGYRIPFAAKIPSTNQFVWLLEYSGPESFESREAQYYGSAGRKRMLPDPARWIARSEQLIVTPVMGAAR